MRAADQFHVGIVAEDPVATRATLSSVFGYEWGEEVGGSGPVTLPDGDTVVDLRCAYTLTEPRVEVVGRVPGTLWEPVAGAGIHHVGYWSADVAADAAELIADGYAMEASRTGQDGRLYFAFLSSPNGFRVELVSTVIRPSLERYWGGP
jgi:hypothetical protein